MRTHERHVRIASDIRDLSSRLDHYRRDNGSYPTTTEGLRALGLVPKDPWANAYVYQCPASFDEIHFNLYSSGPDHKPNTSDDDWGGD